MRISRFVRFFSVLLILTLFSGLMPAAAAGEPSVLDAAEIDAILAGFESERDLSEEHFGFAYYYTGTGESYFRNGDFSTYAASLYKVPLCMRLSEMVKNGELAFTDRLGGYTVEQIEHMALSYSSNPHARAAFSGMGNSRSERWAALNSYSGIPIEELPKRYTQGFFTPRFMLNTLLTLYEEPERFPGVLDYMQQANPEHYFRRTLEGRYTVAQKYGNVCSSANYMHAAGIIYTPAPFLLVVMTCNVSKSYNLLGELADRFAEYTLTLDERLAALPSPTPEPTPEPAFTPEPTPEPVPAPVPEDAEAVRGSPQRSVLVWCGAAGGAVLIAAALLLRKKQE